MARDHKKAHVAYIIVLWSMTDLRLGGKKFSDCTVKFLTFFTVKVYIDSSQRAYRASLFLKLKIIASTNEPQR
jgi:hypothetical protein